MCQGKYIRVFILLYSYMMLYFSPHIFFRQFNLYTSMGVCDLSEFVV